MLQQILTGFSVLFVLAILFHELGEDEKGKGSKGSGGPNMANLFMLFLMPVFAFGGLLFFLGKALMKSFPYLLRVLDTAFQGLKKLLSFLFRNSLKTLHALFTLTKSALSSAWKFLKSMLRSFRNVDTFLGKIFSGLKAIGRFLFKTSRLFGRFFLHLGRFILRYIPSFLRDEIFLAFWFLKKRQTEENDDGDARIAWLEKQVMALQKRQGRKTSVDSHATKTARSASDQHSSEVSDSVQTKSARTSKRMAGWKRGTSAVSRASQAEEAEESSVSKNQRKSVVHDVMPTLQSIGWHTRRSIGSRV